MAIYVQIVGQKQGAIKGAVSARGFVDAIEVDSLLFGFGSPTDIATGQVTGRRVMRPIKMTKPFDKSTPFLITSCDQNENLSKVTFSYTVEGAGHAAYATMVLTNAGIHDFSQVAAANGTATETITIWYTKLEFTWVEGGLAASLDWTAPVT